MKTYVIVLLTICLAVDGAAQHSFDFLYKTPDDKYIFNGSVDLEGNAILVGRIGEYYYKGDGLVMKVQPDGKYMTKRFNKQDTLNRLCSVNILDNGNYLIAGNFGATDDWNYVDYFWVLILDHALEVIAENFFLIDEYYTGFGGYMKSLVDNDRNVCIVGQAIEFVTNPQSPRTDYVMFKLNQEGDTLMSRYYQYPYWQLPYELMIIPDTDSLMLLGGTMSTAGHPTVTIMDKNMQIHTVNHFYISGLSYLLSADFWLNESEFLMAGPNSFSDGRYLDGYIGVYRMNTAGQVFEELVLSIPDTSIYRAWHKSIAYANDSTVYVAGFQAFANNMTPNAVYLFVIDREMNILGSTGFFIGDAQYQVTGILPMHDDGCLMHIAKNKPNAQGVLERDVYIRKYLRENIVITTTVEKIPLEKLNLKLWPNPAFDKLFVSLEGLNLNQNIRFKIFNTNGIMFLDKKLTIDGNIIRCNISNMPAGLYVYEILGESMPKHTGKFIKK